MEFLICKKSPTLTRPLGEKGDSEATYVDLNIKTPFLDVTNDEFRILWLELLTYVEWLLKIHSLQNAIQGCDSFMIEGAILPDMYVWKTLHLKGQQQTHITLHRRQFSRILASFEILVLFHFMYYFDLIWRDFLSHTCKIKVTKYEFTGCEKSIGPPKKWL